MNGQGSVCPVADRAPGLSDRVLVAECGQFP